MTEAGELAQSATSPDPAVGLRATVALRRLADTLERLQVAQARRHGWSWQDIAEVLQVSKQAVHKKYADLDPAARAAPVAADTPEEG
jgi:DNA-directed RNA polymerase specialized sigma24 family protein